MSRPIANDAIGGVIVRYAEVDGYAAPLLDEVVGNFVHVESMGDYVWAWVGGGDDDHRDSGVHMSFHVERLPLSRWWEEIREAWAERRLPSFHRVGMSITSDERRTTPTPTSSISNPTGLQEREDG